MIKYGDKVKIIFGFYEGNEGIVLNYIDGGYKENEYLVKLIDGYKCWIKRKRLRIIK